jgi:hypothetical protein
MGGAHDFCPEGHETLLCGGGTALFPGDWGGAGLRLRRARMRRVRRRISLVSVERGGASGHSDREITLDVGVRTAFRRAQ